MTENQNKEFFDLIFKMRLAEATGNSEEKFKTSTELARLVGLNENEILKSEEEIDQFFMDA